MPRPPHRRQRRAGRSVPEGSRCHRCGCSIRAALQRVEDQWWCYECRHRAAGRADTEKHHVLPRAIDPVHTVAIPGNLHRGMEAAKAGWPLTIRQTRQPSPLELGLIYLLGRQDYDRLGAEHYVQPLIDYLSRLHDALVRYHGPDWPKVLGLPDTLWPGTDL